MSHLFAQGGFPITSIREIRILRTLTHDNIVELLEVVTDSHGKVEDGKVWRAVSTCHTRPMPDRIYNLRDRPCEKDRGFTDVGKAACNLRTRCNNNFIVSPTLETKP